MKTDSVLDTLRARGFVAQCSDETGLTDRMSHGKITVYNGFDPTATSLHVGHLVPLFGMAHFQRHGHKVLLIVGGATAMIGDPSGKSEERVLLSTEQVAKNVECVKKQMAHFLDFSGENKATILDNNDWTSKMSFTDWLREVGKHFTVNYMLAKDSVGRRIESEHGISYTEFSYMTMQSYDFYYLHEHHDCILQCGGDDQWGNITAGIDFIRKKKQGASFGLTFPLITTSTGEKLGKTAGNAIWLDPERTTPWDFYQYLVRQDDRDVIRFLNLLTFVPVSEIADLEEKMAKAPEARDAQRRLAYELTKLVHGEKITREVVQAAEMIYGSEIKDLSDSVLAAAFATVPSWEVGSDRLDAGVSLIDALTGSGLIASRGQAKKLLQEGGVYVNNVRVSDVEQKLTRASLASESYIVIRTGKKNYLLVKVLCPS